MNLEILLTILMSCGIPRRVLAQQIVTGRQRRDQHSTGPWPGTATCIHTDADDNFSQAVSRLPFL